MLQIEPSQVGRYRLVEKLGKGAFGTIYRGVEPQLDRTVAIKILHPNLRASEEFVTRFRREAQILSGLQHENIVRVYDWEFEDGEPDYIVMEWLPGISLHEYMRLHPQLPVDAVCDILERVASALDYAHQRGLVHRDVKLSNIIVELAGDGICRVTLTDFGLAKDLSSEVTHLTGWNVPLGTTLYMAPEQCDPDRADEIGSGTDIYALGIMAYRMLTGKFPFYGSEHALRYAHKYQDPPDPRVKFKPIPGSVARVLLRALRKKPEERYPSASRFVEELRTASVSKNLRLWPIPLIGLPLLLVLGLMVWDHRGVGTPTPVGTVASEAVAIAVTSPTALLSSPSPGITEKQDGFLPANVTARITVPPASATPVPSPLTTVSPVSTQPPAEPTEVSPTGNTAQALTVVPPTSTSRRPTETVTPLSAPVSSSSTESVYVAPTLEAPENGASLSEPTIFRWAWSGTLQEDEYFDVRIWREGEPHNGITWTKDHQYPVDPGLRGPGNFFWSVAIVRGQNGTVTSVLSAEAPARGFTVSTREEPPTHKPYPEPTTPKSYP
ncbi:MAG TPA: hypothetical protein DEP84_14495 [Chloroflexi bacterium]|nr:hypothetical protein [Chloroflexota bacterium]